MRKYLVALCMALTLSLTGCLGPKVSVSPRVQTPDLPPVPQRYITCFQKYAQVPVKQMSGKELTKFVAFLVQSDVRKTDCGRDFIRWYQTVRRSYGT